MKVRRPAVIGTIAGLVFASAIIVLARFNNRWDNEAFRNIINFYVS